MSVDIDPKRRGGRPSKCRAYPSSGKHKFDPVQTDKCQQGQWQNVCACGEMTDDQVWGEPVVVDAKPTLLDDRSLNLDDKLDIDLLVDALFDNNLDWTTAILNLGVTKEPKQARQLAEDWSLDKRVTAAIEKYVDSMAAGNKQRYALLTHHCWKAVQDKDETGAVRATAMNILKSAHVTEKTEHEEHKKVYFEKSEVLRDIVSGITGEEDAPAADPLTIN